MSLKNMALIYRDQNKFEQALEMLEEATAMTSRSLGPDHHNTGASHFSVAKTKMMMFDMAGALESAKEAVRVFDLHAYDTAVSDQARALLTQLNLLVRVGM
jgi:tetratricopeptide (TPR) repeat protein